MSGTQYHFCFTSKEIGQPFDLRIKLYNKGAQYMESSSVFAKVSNGWKHLLVSSNTEQGHRITQTKVVGYSRIEASVKFRTMEAMNDFFANIDSDGMLFVKKEMQFLEEQMNRLSTSFEVSHQRMLNAFFDPRDGCQHTIVVVGQFTIMLMYAFN